MTSKRSVRFLVPVIIASCILLTSACRNGLIEPIPVGPVPTTTTTLAGVVLDETGSPMSGVRVSAGSATTSTNVMGMYILRDVVVPQDRACVIAGRAGYFTSARAAWPGRSGLTTVDLRLIRIGSTTSFSASAGATVRAGGASVEIAPNSLVTASGEVYTGTVTAALRHFDPDTTAAFAMYFSGDASAIRSNGSQTQLLSFGVLRVLLKDDAGRPLQVKNGSTAIISYPVSKALAAIGASTVPLWYFDESTGYWKEEGEASLLNGRFMGYVRHFTDWNLDSPKPRATVQGTVRCTSGRPLSHVMVTIGQVSAMTDDSGHYQHQVPASTAFNVQVQAAFNDGTSSSVVAVPDLAEAEIRTVDLQVSPCSSVLVGTLVDCADQPTSGFVMVTSSKGTKYTSTITGAFRFDVPSGVPLTVTAMATTGQAAPDINVPSITESDLVDLGTVRACGGTQLDFVDLDLGTENPISAAYVDNGQSIAVLTTSMVSFYSTASGALQRTIDLTGGTTPFSTVSGFMFSADERVMLVIGGKNISKIFDAATGTVKSILNGVTAPFLLPSGENVAGGDSTNKMALFSVADGTPVRQFSEYSSWESTVIGSISGGSALLTFDSHFGRFRVLDLATGTATVLPDTIRRIRQRPLLSPDGSIVNFIGEGRQQNRWSTLSSIPSFQTISTVSFASDAEVFSVLAIAHSNQTYLTVRKVSPYQTEPVMLRDVNGTALPRMLLVPSRCTEVKWGAYDPDGSHAAALFRIGGQFTTLRIWKL
jgi:hypothetical protein